MAENEEDIKKRLSWRRIMIPVLIGLIAAGGLLWWNLTKPTYIPVTDGQVGTHAWVDANENGAPDTSDPEEFVLQEGGGYIESYAGELLSNYSWKENAWIAIALALLMVVFRDAGYIYRIRLLTNKFLTWRQSFDVIMLWEFASALTPSVVGGSGVAIFVVNREGINLGKSTATIFITAMMDEIFYIVMVPLLFVIIGGDRLFPSEGLFDLVTPELLRTLFYAGYGFIVLLTTTILLGVFFFPHQTKLFLVKLFSFGFLRRWQHHMVKLGDEIIISSEEFKGNSIGFWAKAMASTAVSWTARFLTLNFIFLAFTAGFDHFEVYGRQLVMWVILLISFTPGSSGIAELLLPAFFNYLPWENAALAPVLLVLVAVIWRLLTYFPYIFVGAAILPGWLRRTAKRKVEQAG
ncbi:MAG: flippase-like domain-containing protein [Flavobacteriales bacterium]|nr:flippase-like domain-containing protein [Flavobacteriales bacterium]